MKVVADRQVEQAEHFLGPLGPVTVADLSTAPGAVLAAADVLVVRSNVKVGRALLEGTPVRCVATATSGTDHIDTAWLAERGIACLDARGSNAAAVAEYIVAACLRLSGMQARPLVGLQVGVVGCGAVGSRVVEMVAALGMPAPLVCDPPRQRAAEDPAQFCDLPTLLGGCDVITLHVPLTQCGRDRTAGLIDAAALQQMRRGAWLINTSRGGVVDESASIAARRAGRLAGLVVDVWQAEPAGDAALLDVADFMTPHIAGQTPAARVRGTWQAARGIAAWAGLPLSRVATLGLPAVTKVATDEQERPESALTSVVETCCDIVGCDRAVRESASAGLIGGRTFVEEARKLCPMRREFASLQVVRSGSGVRVERLGPVELWKLGFS
ncbi:MAG: NAD(P)-dependent oxidoreductase [Phycisphaerae bacterium]